MIEVYVWTIWEGENMEFGREGDGKEYDQNTLHENF